MQKTTPAKDTTPATSRRRIILKRCLLILAPILTLAGIFFRIYGTETHHQSRSDIWWSQRCRELIPPTATDITLRRDLLDHYAIYTLEEKDLNAFLDRRFALPGQTLDSHSERFPARAESVGETVGPLGWIITEHTVSYNYAASNGAAHNFYHDTSTGRTYQSSAYW